VPTAKKVAVDARYDLEGMAAVVREKSVPVHQYNRSGTIQGAWSSFFSPFSLSRVWRSALYYVPHFEHAYKSIVEIVTKLNMGWFFRSLHHWGPSSRLSFSSSTSSPPSF